MTGNEVVLILKTVDWRFILDYLWIRCEAMGHGKLVILKRSERFLSTCYKYAYCQ
jgi:hypothetical protein